MYIIKIKYAFIAKKTPYPLKEQGNIILTRKEDILINKTLTHHTIQSSNSSSGKSSTHISRSGKSHGGGGRKF